MQKIMRVVLCLVTLFISTSVADMLLLKRVLSGRIDSPDELFAALPCTAEEVEDYKVFVLAEVKRRLDAIVAIGPDERTFENTVGAYDDVNGWFFKANRLVAVLVDVLPKGMLRDACERTFAELASILRTPSSIDSFEVDLFDDRRLFGCFVEYEQHGRPRERLTREQAKLFACYYKRFLRDGYDREEAVFARIRHAKKEVGQACLVYERIFRGPVDYLRIARTALTGVSDQYLDSLAGEDGLLLVPLDRAARSAVFCECSDQSTRQLFYDALLSKTGSRQRAIQAMELCMAKRKSLAHLLGYADYATFVCEQSMAGSVLAVRQLLDSLTVRTAESIAAGLRIIRQHAPVGVRIDASGAIHAADFFYAAAHCGRKVFTGSDQQDERVFLFEPTIQRLCEAYGSFFGVTVQNEVIEAPAALALGLRMLSVREKERGAVLGYVVLDLFSRESKHSHPRHWQVTAPQRSVDGSSGVAVGVVLLNMQRAADQAPVVISHSEVASLCHELGHAMHGVLSSTSFALTSGLDRVEIDFVELPSQLCERLFSDQAILEGLCVPAFEHAVKGTDKVEPEELSTLRDTLYRFWRAFDLIDRVILASMSLECYTDHFHGDTTALWRELHALYQPFIAGVPWDSHAFFHHIATYYGPACYSYLWSEIFSRECIERIQQQGGVRNTDIGAKFVRDLLSRGSSVSAREMLRDFLGREPEPETDAFFRACEI